MQHIPFRESGTGARRLFWLVPTVFLFGSTGGTFRATVVGAVLIGVIWQVIYRRDLADRLSFLAVIYLVSAGLAVLAPSAGFDESSGLGLIILIMALVVTEQALRFRDYRIDIRGRRQRKAVPAGP